MSSAESLIRKTAAVQAQVEEYGKMVDMFKKKLNVEEEQKRELLNCSKVKDAVLEEKDKSIANLTATIAELKKEIGLLGRAQGRLQ